jgi:hypothetical protein
VQPWDTISVTAYRRAAFGLSPYERAQENLIEIDLKISFLLRKFESEGKQSLPNLPKIVFCLDK